MALKGPVFKDIKEFVGVETFRRSGQIHHRVELMRGFFFSVILSFKKSQSSFVKIKNEEMNINALHKTQDSIRHGTPHYVPRAQNPNVTT